MIEIFDSCDLRLLLKNVIEKTGSWEGIEKARSLSNTQLITWLSSMCFIGSLKLCIQNDFRTRLVFLQECH
jgi:hypothetical protein